MPVALCLPSININDMAEKNRFATGFFPLSSGFLNTGYGGFRVNKADLNSSEMFKPLVADKEPETPKTPEAPTYGGEPLPEGVKELDDLRRIFMGTPEEQRERARISTDEAVRRTQALMPYQQYAGDYATQRALGASQQFLRSKMQEQKLLDAFRQTLPTTRQMIASARQEQSSAASRDLVSEAQAMALQSAAARDFATAGLGYNRYLGG